MTTVADIRQAWRHPDEGNDVNDADTEVLKARFEALSGGARSWIKELVSQAKRHHCGFHMSEARTVRRYEIYRALILLGEHGDCDDNDVRVLVASVMRSDVPHWPSIAPGHALGALDVAGAAELARLADRYVTGHVVAVVRGGELYVEAVAA